MANWSETLPEELREKLRMNRSDLGTKDSQGLIWMQVVGLGMGKRVLECTTKEAIVEMREALRLGNELGFPERDMVTLLRKEAWREKITGWCSTVFGQEVFAIERWKHMASMQMNTVCRMGFLGAVGLEGGMLTWVTVLVRNDGGGGGDIGSASRGNEASDYARGLEGAGGSQ